MCLARQWCLQVGLPYRRAPVDPPPPHLHHTQVPLHPSPPAGGLEPGSEAHPPAPYLSSWVPENYPARKQSPFEKGCQAGPQEQPGWRRGGMGVQAAARRALTLESRGPAALAPARSPGFRAEAGAASAGQGVGVGGEVIPIPGGEGPRGLLLAPPPELARLVPTISGSRRQPALLGAGGGGKGGEGRRGAGGRGRGGREALSEPRHRRSRVEGTRSRPGWLGGRASRLPAPPPRSPPHPPPAPHPTALSAGPPSACGSIRRLAEPRRSPAGRPGARAGSDPEAMKWPSGGCSPRSPGAGGARGPEQQQPGGPGPRV